MIRIDICCATYCLATQTVAPTIPGFQGIKSCVYYLDIHPHKPIFYPYTSYDGPNVLRLTWSRGQVEYCTTQIFLECHQDAYHDRTLNRRRSFLVLFILCLVLLSAGKYRFNQLYPLTPMMDKLDTFTRMSRKLRLSGDIRKPWHSTLVHQYYIGKITQVLFLLLNLKQLILGLNTLTFLTVFYYKNLIMVSLFQNMRSLVSCRQICAPNHFQVQLSVRVLNG